MNQNQNKEQFMKTYQSLSSEMEPKRPLLRNCTIAFFFGGLLCVFGQAIKMFFIYNFNFNEETAGDPTLAVLIFIAVLLTGFGVYDKIAQFAGAGTAVPVTGFANTMASAAMEYRTEGLVLGTGANMFKLAGPVIVFGTTAAFVVALIKYIWNIFMGG
ncbi:stage V sporulation protein AC [Alteribacillus sp. HJP-4]|uniref:stage V sporulation protein AC n=1 Tax=Alteribacillus sp. HJP-4 TaxID=2775394 RepID=UPI0035CCEA5E